MSQLELRQRHVRENRSYLVTDAGRILDYLQLLSLYPTYILLSLSSTIRLCIQSSDIMFSNSRTPEEVPHNFMLMKREVGHEAMMSNPNDQGISYVSKDITMMLTIMALFKEQQQNDITSRRDYEKISNNIMTQTRKSLSLSMSNIILSCDVDPHFKSSSLPGKRVVIKISSATKRSQHHDGGTSIQGQRTSHNSNKEQQAPIDLCSHRGSTGFHESAR